MSVLSRKKKKNLKSANPRLIYLSVDEEAASMKNAPGLRKVACVLHTAGRPLPVGRSLQPMKTPLLENILGGRGRRNARERKKWKGRTKKKKKSKKAFPSFGNSRDPIRQAAHPQKLFPWAPLRSSGPLDPRFRSWRMRRPHEMARGSFAERGLCAGCSVFPCFWPQRNHKLRAPQKSPTRCGRWTRVVRPPEANGLFLQPLH